MPGPTGPTGSFNLATATFTSLYAATGGFSSLQAGTGTFSTLMGTTTGVSSLYLVNALTTLTTNAYVATLASTGAANPLVYSTTVNRGVAATGPDSFISTLTLTPGWWRAAYSIDLASVPSNATVKAQLLSNGVVLPDSVSMEANLAPTATSGLGAITVTQPAKPATLVGFSHFALASNATLTASLSCTSGTALVQNGSFEAMLLN